MQWNPEDYAQNSDAQLRWAQELRQRLQLQGHESVLDVGCGDGKITADFACCHPTSKIVGIDSSAEMIAYAKRTYPASQYLNLEFACGDARNFQCFPEFDLVFSNATLHWVDDHLAFLKAARQALKPDGILMVSCGGRGNAEDILTVFAELIATQPWCSYFQGFTNPYYFFGTEDYAPWLETVGLAVKRLECVPKDMIHLGSAGLAGWIRTTWMPFWQQVPERLQTEFIDEFVKRYLQQHPLDPQGNAHVQMVRLEVEARLVSSSE
jgi:trans-aconitate 2-methyltransferase